MAQKMSERIDQLKTDVAAYHELSARVKRVCLDLLYGAADQSTIALALSAEIAEWQNYDVLKAVGGSNPQEVNNILRETLALIEEAVYGSSLPERPIPDTVPAG